MGGNYRRKKKETCSWDNEDKSPESEEQGPDDANNAPRRFIGDDTVGRERANPKDGKKAQRKTLEKQGKRA